MGWFCVSDAPHGWFDIIVMNMRFENMMLIVGDGPQCPNHPKWTPGGTLSKHEVFAPFGPKRVHPQGWAGFGLKTREGVHREGGRGEGKPSPLIEGSSTPTKVDGFSKILGRIWDGLGMILGRFGGIFGTVSDRF